METINKICQACDVLAPSVQSFTRQNKNVERTSLGGCFTFLALLAIAANSIMLVYA
jgi:hypothetical protein